MFRRIRNPVTAEASDWYAFLRAFEVNLLRSPLVPLPISQTAARQMGLSKRGVTRLRQLPIYVRSDYLQEVPQRQHGANMLFGFAIELIPEVMIEFLITGILSRVLVLADTDWQQLSDAYAFVREAGNGLHVFNVASGRSTVILRHANGIISSGDRYDAVTHRPDFVFAHEVGHAFQFLSSAEDRRSLHTVAVAQGYAGTSDHGVSYVDDVESSMGAWVEAFADIFGFFYTNRPVGLRPPWRHFDRIIRRLHDSAQRSRSVEDWLSGLEVA